MKSVLSLLLLALAGSGVSATNSSTSVRPVTSSSVVAPGSSSSSSRVVAPSSTVTSIKPTATTPANNTIDTRFATWERLDFLACTPSDLKITDGSTHRYKIACALKQQPKGPLVVLIESAGLKFTKCSLNFDQNNWNRPQEFEAIPQPDATNRAVQDMRIYFTANGPTETCHRKITWINYSRDVRKAAVCTISGDPHILTFMYPSSGHKMIDYQGGGEYYLVESTAGLRVVGSYFQVGKVSFLAGLSIQYANTTILVSILKKAQATDNLLDVKALTQGTTPFT